MMRMLLTMTLGSLIIPTTTQPCDLRYVVYPAVGLGAIALITHVYAEYTCDRLTSTYATAHQLAGYAINADQHHLLQKEIFRAYDAMLRAQPFAFTPYKGVPYVWYAHTLDTAINDAKTAISCAFGGNCKQTLQELLPDLLTIRDYVITNYDYIKELQYYTNTQRAY